MTQTTAKQSTVTRAKYFILGVNALLGNVKDFNAFKNLKASEVIDEGMLGELRDIADSFGESQRVPLKTKLQNLISKRSVLYSQPMEVGADGKVKFTKKWTEEAQRLNAEIEKTETAIERKAKAAQKAEEETAEEAASAG